MTAALEFQSSTEMRRRYSDAKAKLWGPPPRPRRFIAPPTVKAQPTPPDAIDVRIKRRPCRKDDVAFLSEIKRIQWLVCHYYQVDRLELLSARRHAQIIKPRHVAMYLSKTLTLKSLPEIGRRFGGRDHTTVLSAVRRITARLKTDEVLANDIQTLTEWVRA